MLRRSFLSRFASAPALFGFGAASQSAATDGKATAGRFESARHEQDDWLDKLPGRHRVVFDTWMAGRFSEAIGFSGNYFRASRDGYNLADKDLAVVVVVRHQTAPFAFNDAMWAKYGKQFSDRMSFLDPKTNEVPKTNPYGTQVANLVKQGAHLAVCNLTTRAYTRILADVTGGNADDIYKELTTNTLGNSHFVPAGVVGVTRAQEHGYVLVSVG
jgi:intracellular sulfur oxidation DsrE/DsrF family protein